MRSGFLSLGLLSGGASPLAISPSAPALESGQAQTFSASGGVGPYTYSLVTNNSGGVIVAATGVYVPGLYGGVDTVRVTDSMGHTSDATVTVTAIGGLALYYANESLGSGSLVTWNDTSGAANHLGVVGSPTIAASDASFGGKKSVPFNGSTQWAASASTIVSGVHTMVMVAKFSGTAGYIAQRFNTPNLDYLFGSTGYTMNCIRSGGTSQKDLSANWDVDGVARTILRRMDGTHAGHTLRLNGVTQTLANGASQQNPGSTSLTAKWNLFASNTGTSKSTGSLVEAAYFTAAITDTQAERVEALMQAKFSHY